MIFADKLITLRKKAGWSQEELAEKLGVTRQSVSKWEGAQSVPDIDKILQLARLFGVTTDYLLKEEQGEPEYTAEDDTPALHRVTLTQAGDYLKKARANAPRMALATALCVLSPVSLLALCALSEYNLLGISENFAAGLGLCILLALVAVAVVLFMQCGAAVKPYEFLEKEPIDTEYGVTGLVRERRDAFAAHYNRANTIGTVLCILAAVPLFAAMMCNADLFAALSVCLLMVLVACGVYAFVWAGTVHDAMDQLLEEGDFTRDAKARKGGHRRGCCRLLASGGSHFPVLHLRSLRQRPAAVQLVHLGHRRCRVCCRYGCNEGRPAKKAIKRLYFSPKRAYNRAIFIL